MKKILAISLLSILSINASAFSKVGDTVTFKPASTACGTQKDFLKAQGYAITHNMQGFDKMLSSFACAPLPTDEEYKILKIHKQENGTLLINFMNVKTDPSKYNFDISMWASYTFIEE